MDELQVGLLALGGTAVVAVFAYNKWQEYRHRKLLEQVLNQKHSDVLLDQAVSAEVVLDRPVYAQDSAIEQERLVAELEERLQSIRAAIQAAYNREYDRLNPLMQQLGGTAKAPIVEVA